MKRLRYGWGKAEVSSAVCGLWGFYEQREIGRSKRTSAEVINRNAFAAINTLA